MKLPVSQPWYADGLSFKCSCCGNCCTGGPGFVWMSSEEVDLLAEHLNLSRKQTLEQYCRRIGSRISLNERRNAQGQYDCVFLKDLPAEKIAGKATQPRRVCGIYEVRPLQCRTWPFWDGNLSSARAWDKASERCPGMNRGKKYSLQQIEALNTARQWPDKPPTSGAGKLT